MKPFSWKITTLVLLLGGLVAAPALSLFWAWGDVRADLWEHILKTSLSDASLNTLSLLAVVLPGTFVVGTPLAWASAHRYLPAWLEVLLALPLVFPKYVLGFAYLSMTDYSGPLQSALRTIGIDGSGLLQTGTLLPIAFVLILALYPYVFLFTREGLLNIDQDVMAAARLFGATPGQVFTGVALPVVRPWIVSSLLIVALECIADFGTVAIFNFDTYTTLLYKTWFGLQSFSLTAQLGSLLLVLCVVLFLGQHVLKRQVIRFQTSPLRTVGDQAVQNSRRLWTTWGGAVCFLGFALPLGYLVTLALELKEWPRSMGEALMTTVVYGFWTGFAVTSLAAILTITTRRSNRFSLRMVKAFSRTGFAVPGIVLATGVLTISTAFDQGFDGDFVLGGTLFATIFGLSVKFLMFGQDSLENRVEQIPRSIEESAILVGATEWRLAWDFYRPLLWRAVGTCMLIVFVEAAKEMPITLMTRSFGRDSLAVKIFEYTSEGEYEYAAVPSLILCLLGMFVAFAVPRRNKI